MKLATIRGTNTTHAVRIDDDEAVELGVPDVGVLLQTEDWQSVAARADGTRRSLASLDYAPLVPRPDKIVCVGLNYRTHILEMGRDLPAYPTLFAKYRGALIGANDPISLPTVADVDWEAELAVVIGTRIRHATRKDAERSIAGYAILNDVSMRDYQNRTLQWLQGKTFEASTPVGPWLVTADESPGPSREITCAVNGERVQHADTSDLVFGPAELVAYISEIITLEPGDLIATGTPGGVGAACTPPRFLAEHDTVTTRISGLGEATNVCRREQLG